MGWLREVIDALMALFKWFFIVEPWDRAIRTRLGKNVRVYQPGIHFCIPYLDKVYVQNRRRRISPLDEQTLSTIDRKVVTVCGTIGYQIDDIMKLYRTLHQAEATVKMHAMQYVTEYIIERNLDEVTPQGLSAYVRAKMNLEQFGLKDPEFFLTTFAVVKTYRFITEGINNYGGGGLSTMNPSSSNSGVDM